MIELASAGMTDYVAIPLSGLDTRNVITVATKKSGGFTEDEIASMTKLFKLFALHVQRHSESKISENALGAYLGSGAAAKVLDGAIKRGAGRLDPGCDLGFRSAKLHGHIRCAASRRHARAAQCVLRSDGQRSRRAHGGEILKFIGDGLLAVFPVTAGIAHASRSAVLAAEEAAARLAAFNLAVTVPVSRPNFGPPSCYTRARCSSAT